MLFTILFFNFKFAKALQMIYRAVIMTTTNGNHHTRTVSIWMAI